ncbi:phospholipase A [Luteimonas mephitis]|uniref:phospholipase A n=1 Tax=Luteimonas mephitis TaxID=83615 RepID=UPI003A8D0147
MTPSRAALALFPLGLAAAAGPAIAQSAGTPAAGNIDACALVEVDADRLACYDRVAGRHSRNPAMADAAAELARQNREAASEAEAAAATRGDRARSAASDLFASEPEDAIANAGKGSLLDSRWELARDSKLGTFNFRAYKPVYLLPAFWSSDQNELPHSPNPRNTATEPQVLDAIEAKFQISFKTKAWENLFGDNGDVWMGYTQSSRWQVYNGEASRPFRETNYEPEILLVFRNNYSLGGWKGRMAAVGINHQSNGRADPLSRSWNRVMFNVGLDRDNWAVTFRPWIRVSDGSDDDNPDIEDYMGRGDVTIVHTIGGHELSLMARHSLRGGDRSHGAIGFDWGFPIHNTLRGHVQVFDGYGESLIDYNHRSTYIGLGISLLEWF